jgi:hypothetical protein
VDEQSPGFVPAAGCTKLVLGTVSERPKDHVSKTCVGVNSTVGSNPTGTARGLFAKLKQYVRETQPQTKDLHLGGGPLSLACQPGLGDLPCLGLAGLELTAQFFLPGLPLRDPVRSSKVTSHLRSEVDQ